MSETDAQLAADRELIIAATTYRSGNDSCGSVYMGGMAMSMLGHIVGHGGWKDDRRLNDVIRAAPRAKIDKAGAAPPARAGGGRGPRPDVVPWRR